MFKVYNENITLICKVNKDRFLSNKWRCLSVLIINFEQYISLVFIAQFEHIILCSEPFQNWKKSSATAGFYFGHSNIK